jgi:hypothetical protein
MNPSVDAIVQLFVKKDKRERILSLAGKPKRRDDFRDDLLHDTRSLDPAVLAPLAAGASAESVVKALRAKGAGDRAYCISTLSEVDDLELSLAEAMKIVFDRDRDTLVFPIGSSVAYYENHDGDKYVLHRKR